MLATLILFITAFAAGVQNALAGGGSFLTFPALLFAGLDPRAANITSTVALFPGQVATGLAGRHSVARLPALSFRALFVISLLGGAVGAVLLLATPVGVFTHLVPWLVLFATLVFMWGSFFRKPAIEQKHVSAPVAATLQFAIAIYGGYFGGGIGILMLAMLTLAGQAVRNAGATKNVLAGVMNASAVLIFLFSSDVSWRHAFVLAIGAIIGGQVGAYALHRINEKLLRICITVLGFLLTVGLFWKALHS